MQMYGNVFHFNNCTSNIEEAFSTLGLCSGFVREEGRESYFESGATAYFLLPLSIGMMCSGYYCIAICYMKYEWEWELPAVLKTLNCAVNLHNNKREWL
jgi:hypothetical protein